MNRRRLPKYCSEFRDRHGKVRVRFRRKGQATYYFKAAPWSAEFMQEYRACIERKAAPEIEPGEGRTVPGSVSALIVAYYRSPEFRGLADSTRATYRNILERFRKVHGSKRVATLERHHIKAMIAAKADTPAAANNLLDRLKVLMAFAVEIGMRRDDPTHKLKGFRTSSEGFHTWTEEEIEAFEAAHPVGSRARLAMALMLYTGQRRSDAVRMGWQHVEGRRINVVQQKTKRRLKIPIHPRLAQILSETPRENMTFLVTAAGKPFTPAGFGNWFRECCNQAGLPHCSAHGLRKAAARRLAEAGASNQVIKSITGHVTDSEAARYTRDADQVKLSDQAYRLWEGQDVAAKMANPEDRLAIFPPKPLPSKED